MKYLSKLYAALILTTMSVSAYAADIVVPAGKTTVDSYANSTVTVSDNADLHITSATPLSNSTITLSTENSWLFFDNLRPSEVISSWLQYVKVGDVQAANGTNVRVEIYLHGTVVIPHSSSISPLSAFDAAGFAGNSQQYNVNYHKSLGTMDNKIRSFKLKRGYMATLATASNGRGFSRVFIADHADLEISQLQPELDRTVSFIRVLKWFYPSVKGVCGSGDGYVQLTQSTWWYNWGAGSNGTSNYEFVPIKWGAGGNFNEINNKQNVTHLLGYNEPDHEEQSNVSVATAIQEWPGMLESGLRIGSPACTDFNWLYNFIDECDRLNYRVDFVAVHAYWGGKSPQAWYNDLKYIHERTGRPIWITEWNNGANWTNEGGWERNSSSTSNPKPLLDSEANRQKQLRDITAILQVMDTASFIERQSLYNWVETARMIVTNSDNNNRALTPAGEYYRDDHPQMAFKRSKEYLPTWNLRAPIISSHAITNNNTQMELNLTSSVYNELNLTYIVEEKIGTDEYTAIANISNMPIVNKLTIPISTAQQGIHSYRLRAIDRAGTTSDPSNEVSFVVSANSNIQFDVIEMPTVDWTTMYFGQTFSSAPVAVLGTPSNKNIGVLMSNRIQSLTGAQMKFKLYPWKYITSTFTYPEKLPYLILPAGAYDWDGVKATAATTTSNGEWKTVTFDVPAGYFTEPPIVIPTQVTTLSSTATSIHIRNVTATGFEICLRHEAAQTYAISNETIHYVALSEGKGVINGKKIITGKIEDVGHLTRLTGTISWNDAIENPLIFTHKQTTNNTYASNLRITSNTATQAKVLNQIERSTTATIPGDTPTDQVGWVVIEGEAGQTSIENILANADKITLYPNPVVDILYIKSANNEDVKVSIYNLQGVLVKSASGKISQINLSSLPKGFYFVDVNGKAFKILKQ